MLSLRPFRNLDPPVLSELWRGRGGQRGLRQPISIDLLEQLVFAKLYFDYEGLIVARDDGRPVGFAHAAFGPDPSGTRLATHTGVVCLVLVHPAGEQAAAIGRALIERCEQYLIARGARTIRGGMIDPLGPFYLGLYGGATLPGVLDADAPAREAFVEAGYREVDRTVIVQRDLRAFEAPVDRRQFQIRRQMTVEVAVDPSPRSFYEASVLGEFDLVGFELRSPGAATPAARALFRSMDPGAMVAGQPVGLVELAVEPSLRGRGLASFLLSEAARHFQRQDMAAVEAVVPQNNLAALGLLHKLGFQQTGHGSIFGKER